MTNIRQTSFKNGVFTFLTWFSWAMLVMTVLLLVLVVVGMVWDKPVEPIFSSAVRTLHVGNDSWDWIAVCIACISLFYGCITFNSQHKTEQNTMKITPESQQEILLDLIRHYYRNMVIVCAIETKLAGRFNEFYPSQEHLLKLKVDVEDLHPAAFYNNPGMYRSIHELVMKMRNLNTEAEVAGMHLSSRSVCTDAKLRDFATLKFKMGYLTGETVNTINKIWPDCKPDNIRKAKDVIKDASERYNKNILPEAKSYIESLENPYPYFSNTRTFYTQCLFTSDDEQQEFLTNLNANIRAEMLACDDNGFSNAEKIFLIPFADR